MKKRLIKVCQLEQVKECPPLQEDYKENAVKLYNYCKSIKNYIQMGKDVETKLGLVAGQLEELLRFKCEKIKSTCQIDYYSHQMESMLTHTISLLKSAAAEFGKGIAMGTQIRVKAKSVLKETEEIFKVDTDLYNTAFKNYMKIAYPATDGVLFKWKLQNKTDLPKQDSSQDESMIESARKYHEQVDYHIRQLQDHQQSLQSHCQTDIGRIMGSWIKESSRIAEELESTKLGAYQAERFAESLSAKSTRSNAEAKSEKGKDNGV